MDVLVCHLNGCPLDLDALLNAKKSDFLHDLNGIDKNINRNTGKMENCFLPKCNK